MAPILKPESRHEHPVVARISLLAILFAILLILWARYELYGTQDLEQTLSGAKPRAAAGLPKPSPDADRSKRKSDVDDAVAAGRWATGFSR